MEELMKRIFLLTLLASWPLAASAQSFVNPDTIYQHGNIILQNTNVYYRPMAAPRDTDTRVNLCNESDLLRDPNGVGIHAPYRDYTPIVYDTFYDSFVNLQNWHPCDTSHVLGPNAYWPRLFQAMNKPDGTPSDIVVGDSVIDTTSLTGAGHPVGRGRVIISKNEDVDFRATGRIKLKSGFKVMPGAFFHAYTEPKWDTAVFSDEFDSAAKFHNQWYVANGNFDNYVNTPQISYDSDVRLWHDTGVNGAHDGWALDIMLREDTVDTFYSRHLGYSPTDSCKGSVATRVSYDTSIFSSAIMHACPYPLLSNGSPLGPVAYAHMPYGKYEFRAKLPNMPYHTNNWGGSADLEYDLDEVWYGAMGQVHPNWGHRPIFGPCHGYFASSSLFVSHDAGWGTKYYPQGIIVNNIFCPVAGAGKDSAVVSGFMQNQGGFPASLVASHDIFTFYFVRSKDSFRAATVTWHVTQASDGKWRIFSAPYAIDSLGDSSLFTKNYQPTELKLTTGYDSISGKYDTTTHRCYWVDSANDPHNYGKLYLIDPIDSGALHSFTEPYQYQMYDQGTYDYGYPIPTVKIGLDTTEPCLCNYDTAQLASMPYKYHTYGMEWLPHEVRILYDSVVVRRIPDRLVPRSSIYYDWAGTESRSPTVLRPAEVDLDGYWNDTTSNGWEERKYFEAHASDCLGCWPDANGHPAAHHMLDYVKVWDIPKDVKIPDYPH